MPSKREMYRIHNMLLHKYFTKLGKTIFPAGISPSAQPTLMLNDFQQNLLVMIATTTNVDYDDITK